MSATSKITVTLGLWGLASVLLLVSCNGNGTQQRTSKRVLSDFEFLQLGMGYEEVVARVGESDRDAGSGVHLMVYELDDGTEIVLSFPSLTSLAAVHHYDPASGERELILGSDG
ncbi:MAG: hypothetical protein ACC647_09675 [Anaerolineales bacterium]